MTRISLYRLAAGILGIVAGAFALRAASLTAHSVKEISRQVASRETEALKNSLAVEIRQSVSLLCQTHQFLTDAKAALRREGDFPHACNIAKLTTRVHPTVYPATADRIGHLGHPLAELTVMFYANVKDIQFAGELTASAVPTRRVSLEELNGLVGLLEVTCRDALPLLSLLPPDDADVDLKAGIEAMGQPSAAPPLSGPPSPGAGA